MIYPGLNHDPNFWRNLAEKRGGIPDPFPADQWQKITYKAIRTVAIPPEYAADIATLKALIKALEGKLAAFRRQLKP